MGIIYTTKNVRELNNLQPLTQFYFMKEMNDLPRKKKKNSQKPSTILIIALCLIGFTGIASYKPAPANTASNDLLSNKTKAAVISDAELAALKEDFVKELSTNKVESAKIESIMNFYNSHLFGIDVSHYQGIIKWDQLQFIKDTVPVNFIFMRASVGKDTPDKHFQRNWVAAGRRNFVRGAYHYYRPDENSAQQARNFINRVKLNPGDLPPVLDIEALPRRQSVSSLRKGIQNWLNIIENHYGVKPIIYTGDTFYQHHLAGHGFDNYKFWIANYNHVPEPNHQDWGIWQFSMKGRIAGINHDVDLNVFKGNHSDLQKLRIPS